MQTLFFASGPGEPLALAAAHRAFSPPPPEETSCIDVGLPADRAARLAARKAFVEMKHIFMRAVAPLPAGKGSWLREQVRAAREPTDLWLLRGAVLAALFHDDRPTRDMRAEIYRGLDSLFPDSSLGADDSAGPSTLAEWPWQATVPSRAGAKSRGEYPYP
jgi:hypothetical protein